MIIGIAGKKQAGKDTVAKLLQYGRIGHSVYTWQMFLDRLDDGERARASKITVHRFADKLKDIVCLITGCTREELEKEEFKNSLLPKEWKRDMYYKTLNGGTLSEPMGINPRLAGLFFKLENEIPTYRQVLQEIGTDLFRNLFHPDTWVNATMADYKPKVSHDANLDISAEYPIWIIPDVRFPNEVKAIKERDGFIIKVERSIEHMAEVMLQKRFSDINPKGLVKKDIIEDLEKFRSDQHPSEIALDTFNEWDAVIQNDCSIPELLDKVRPIIREII